jgi:hypothetical protein
MGLPAALMVVPEEATVQYIRLCDPAQELVTAEQHVKRSQEFLSVLRAHGGGNN